MTPEQQRKMLECAAKACGIELTYENGNPQRVVMFRGNLANYEDWNPLANGLDTAEMCADLRISVLYEHDPCEFLACFAHNSHDPEIAHYKDHDNSRLNAWMFAATMVAAKIGGYEA